MVGGVVVADGCVEAAGAHGKIAIGLVSELISFDVGAELVGIVRAEYDLRQEIQVIGKLGREEKIKLARLKCGVGRRRRVPARSASVVDDRKYQGIRDRSQAEVEVEESSELHDRDRRESSCRARSHVHVRNLGGAAFGGCCGCRARCRGRVGREAAGVAPGTSAGLGGCAACNCETCASSSFNRASCALSCSTSCAMFRAKNRCQTPGT